ACVWRSISSCRRKGRLRVYLRVLDTCLARESRKADGVFLQTYMLVSILTGVHAFQGQELPVEMCHVVVAAAHGDIGDAPVAFSHRAADFVDAQDVDEADERLTRGLAEKSAESRWRETDQICDIDLADLLAQVLAHVSMDQFDAPPVQFGAAIRKVVVRAGQIA